MYQYTTDKIFYYSVKLKHFKKFEDMTEALSGNTTMVLFNVLSEVFLANALCSS